MFASRVLADRWLVGVGKPVDQHGEAKIQRMIRSIEPAQRGGLGSPRHSNRIFRLPLGGVQRPPSLFGAVSPSVGPGSFLVFRSLALAP